MVDINIQTNLKPSRRSKAPMCQIKQLKPKTSSSISSLITDTFDDCEEYLPPEETSEEQVRFRESEK